MWRVRRREELFHRGWACCAELSAWRCDMLRVDEAGLGSPAGDVSAIESLEDRGGGLPGQDGVVADCSCATHW